jgi:aminoglycoside 3-N-acetyltransferase I
MNRSSRRLTIDDRVLARALFAVMAEAFEEDRQEIGDDHIDRLLSRDDFWAIAAVSGDEVIGGLTAHTLPMTRDTTSEIFIYDLAVRRDHQRQGVGRDLVAHLRQQATAVGIDVVFVPADNDDIHALDFYRAIGGAASPVTFFVFDSSK